MNELFMEDLTIEERQYVETYVVNHRKNPVVAWLLWIFLGTVGAHRMYMNRVGSGVAQLLLWFPGWLLLFIPNLIWVIYDAFQINKWVREAEDEARLKAIADVKLMRK